LLLSIERIEVVDSRLIVVTELADKNLSERFEECRTAGMPGVPRDELLGYLKDAADALDFMSEQHGLQHLDIKPDNLLLQGNHAKVGDFGMAKNIAHTNVSALDGFTPRFAAPELFEGRPSRASDQYSLAIVYQMMLTGNPPFNGRTAAQLTAQHLRSQPDLTELQPIDRPVIARALSKNVHSRFDSCRQFVDELFRRRPARTTNRIYVPGPAAADDGLNRTSLVQTQGAGKEAGPQARPSTPVAWQPAETEGPQRRCLFVGVGGIAGAVLKQLKTRRNGASDPLPQIPLLQIDTDRSALAMLRPNIDDPGLLPDETICIPLKSSKHYRGTSELDLSWLSRRWLFNIPKSGQVDGIRPLGRLALYDHRVAVRSRMEQLLKSATDRSSADAPSSAQAAASPAAQPGLDIYVVAAITGGTGSGAVADVALMMRRVAAEAGISDVTIHGILIHGTTATRNVTDVQDANTVATLRELRQLHTPGLGIRRGFEKRDDGRDTPPFDHRYFVHLGDGLNDVAFRERLTEVTGYLFNASLTGAQADFSKKWRQAETEESVAPSALNLLGLGSQDVETYTAASSEGGNLSALVIRRWCGVAAMAGSSERHLPLPAELSDTETLLTELHLTADSLPRHVMHVLKSDYGRDLETLAGDLWRKLSASVPPSAMSQSAVSNFLSIQLPKTSPSEHHSLPAIVTRLQNSLATNRRTCETTVIEHLRGILDMPHRLEGALTAGRFSVAALKSAVQVCDDLSAEIGSAFTVLEADASAFEVNPATGTPSPDGVRNYARQHCMLLAYQTIYHCFAKHVSALAGAIESFLEQVAGLRHKLEEASVSLQSQALVSDSVPAPIVDAFDKHLRGTCRTLLSDVLTGKLSEDNFRSRIGTEATQFLLAATGAGPGTGSETARNTSHRFPANVWPHIRECGGRRRVLGLVPTAADRAHWQSVLEKEFGDCVGLRPAATDAVSVVCEIADIPVESILTPLTYNNPHVAEISGRVHTRIDIDW
ncbi:MAG: protein kinase, partial [Planctomycetaceae bacterium]|nr:protein kinase [Planctomycetaceae bacterium]